MKKIILLLFLINILLIPCFSEEKPIITVLDFSTNNISKNDMQSIISLLSSALFRSDSFTVIDIGQRANILNELEFSNSGCSDETCQLEIGKILSAEMIVVGDIAKVGNRYILTTKMMETESGKTLETFDGLYADIDELIDNVFLISDRFSLYIKDTSVVGRSTELPGQKLSQEDSTIPTISEKESKTENVTETIKETPQISDKKIPLSDKEYNSNTSIGNKAAAVSTLIVGIISSGIGGYFIYDAVQFNTSTLEPSYNAYEAAYPGDDFSTLWSDYETNYDTFKPKALLASGFTAGGIVMLGISIILFLSENENNNADVALNIDYTNHITELSVSVSY